MRPEKNGEFNHEDTKSTKIGEENEKKRLLFVILFASFVSSWFNRFAIGLPW